MTDAARRRRIDKLTPEAKRIYARWFQMQETEAWVQAQLAADPEYQKEIKRVRERAKRATWSMRFDVVKFIFKGSFASLFLLLVAIHWAQYAWIVWPLCGGALGWYLGQIWEPD